jgi:hypothetical protein
MTTRSNLAPAFTTTCPTCRGELHIFQARGVRGYLYTRCACGFSQHPHNRVEQARLWSLLPESVRASLATPLILAAPERHTCPCCGRSAA